VSGALSGPVVLRGGVVIPDDALTWRFSRSSGPGGQSVNTTDSRAELSVDLDGLTWSSEPQRERVLERLAGRLRGEILTVTASEHRSQLRNREAALARITALLDEALAPPGAATPGREAQPRVARATQGGRAAAPRGQAAAPTASGALTTG